MELDEYLQALRKRWAIIVVLTVVGGALGFLHARSTPPTYKASAAVFVSVNEGASAGELVQGSTFVQNSVESFGQLASTPIVLEPVIEKLGLHTTPKALGHQVSADAPLNSMILTITTTDTQPARAAAISNAVATQLSDTVKSLSPRTTTGASSIAVSVIAPAVEPGAPFKPRTRFLTATGMAVGLALGVALALLLTVLDTRVRTRSDLERISGLPVLGAIIRVKSANQAYVTMRTDPTSARAEAFRRLQANLQYLQTSRPLSAIVVTSALSAEGKTSTAVNLAVAVAEKGGSVLLIDADLRRPTVAKAIGIEGGVGLTTVLIGQATLDEVVQPWGMDNLFVLPSGEQPPNPSQLLDSPAMHRLIEEAVTRYDLVIIDSPPILPVIDAAVLGRHTDGVLLVARMRKSRRQQVQAALAALDRVGATCLGLVATSVVDDGSGPAYSYVYKAPTRKRSWRRRRAGTASPISTPQRPAAQDTEVTAESPPSPERPSTAEQRSLAADLRRESSDAGSVSMPEVDGDAAGDASADEVPEPRDPSDEPAEPVGDGVTPIDDGVAAPVVQPAEPAGDQTASGKSVDDLAELRESVDDVVLSDEERATANDLDGEFPDQRGEPVPAGARKPSSRQPRPRRPVK